MCVLGIGVKKEGVCLQLVCWVSAGLLEFLGGVKHTPNDEKQRKNGMCLRENHTPVIWNQPKEGCGEREGEKGN